MSEMQRTLDLIDAVTETRIYPEFATTTLNTAVETRVDGYRPAQTQTVFAFMSEPVMTVMAVQPFYVEGLLLPQNSEGDA